MSTTAALALIATTVFTACFLGLSTIDKCTQRAGQILNGVQDGVPISMDYRKILVFQSFVPPMANMLFLNVFDAIVMLGVACSVGPDSMVRWMAYATLIFHGAAALQWLGNASISVAFFFSLQRKVEADRP